MMNAYGVALGSVHPPMVWRRKRQRINLATVASAMALSIAVVSAFQAPSSHVVHSMKAFNGLSSQLEAVTDPDTLLKISLDNVYYASPDDYRGVGLSENIEKTTSNRARTKNGATSLRSKTKRVNGVSLNKRKATVRAIVTDETMAKSNKKSNRKATMPGFSTRSLTGREKSFRDGVRIVEQRTGKKYKETPADRRNRRKVNGEAMYKTSASVPDSLVQFASEIHSVERISPTEEILLGEKTQEFVRLQNLHTDLKTKLDRDPTDEEWCAAAGKINLVALQSALDEGLEAKNKLVTSNLRMVQSVVNIYIRNGLGAEYNAGDMMQEGIVALIRAAEKFDPDKGFRFSTYAMYWIRSAVKRSQIVQSHLITVPQRLYENHKRILRVEKELKENLGRKPTKKEIGEIVGMSEVQIERCMKAMEQRCYSLDQSITNIKKPLSGDGDKDTLIELVESKTDDSDYCKQKRVFLREDLIQTLYHHLQPEEVQILLLRYGLMDEYLPERGFGPLTIAEVGRFVGYKPDKVRRIINKSLKQLKAIIGKEWLDYERELQQ